MATISLNGPDGAGKTTISQRLLAEKNLHLKYIYMGINFEATNLSLPTSRLAVFLKRRRKKKATQSRQGEAGQGLREDDARRSRSKVRSAIRIMLYLAEEWYRQGLSLIFQLRGYTVLFDRHFLIDFSLEEKGSDGDSLSRRFHRWSLQTFYPPPGLVIFLDAPGHVLFDRKGEKTPEELERRRQSFLALKPLFPDWVTIDATQPLEVVYQQVREAIRAYVHKN